MSRTPGAVLGTDGFGSRVRQTRDRCGLSQKVLAHRSGISREWLGRIELGRAEASASHAVAIHQVLARELPEVGLVWLLTGAEGQSAGRVIADVNKSRRRFLKATAALALPVNVDLERLASHTRLDADLLDGFEAATEMYARMRPSLPPRELLPHVELHLASLSRRVADERPLDAMHRRLLSVAAGSAALAAWICFMLERRRDAREHLDMAEPLARESRDDDTLALILMLRADLLSAVPSGGVEGFPALAQRTLDQGLWLVAEQTPLAIRAPLLLRSAEEHAFLGNEGRALDCLDQAAALAAGSGGRHHYLRPTWGRAPDVERVIASFRGSVLQMVGRPDEAIQILASAPTSRFPADRPPTLTDLAAAHARRGELDRTCELLNQAIDLVVEHDLPVAARRIAGVRRLHLAAWDGEPSVSALDERIAAIL